MRIQSSAVPSVSLFEKKSVDQGKNQWPKEQSTPQDIDLQISDEGLAALKQSVQMLIPETETTEVFLLTAENTNEIEFEHYSKMLNLSQNTYEQIRKSEGRDPNINDIMKSMMDIYKTLYNEIVDAHANGDRNVDYSITGKQSISLKQDLDGLDKAFNRRLANLEGYITSQQTNKLFAQSDNYYLEYQNRKNNNQSVQNDSKDNRVETTYQDLVKSIMLTARNTFLQISNTQNYHKGLGTTALIKMMNSNDLFIEGTKTLFS